MAPNVLSSFRGLDTSRLAIVGSKNVSSPTASRIIMLLLELYKPAVVVSGGAVGVDTLAYLCALELGIEPVVFRPATADWETGYKPRNMLIAQDCTALVRIGKEVSQTYGSGWTRDRAAQLGKPTMEFLLP